MEMNQFAVASIPSRAAGLSTMETDLDCEGDKRDSIPVAGGEKGYEMEMRKYEQDIRAFDRIAWVDVHILHSTVCRVILHKVKC
jgi:hypothetical protein